MRVLEQDIDEPFVYADNSVEIRTYVVVMMKVALMLSGLPHQHYEMNQGYRWRLALAGPSRARARDLRSCFARARIASI